MNANTIKLFKELKNQKIDLYILFLSDPHLSEYLAERFQSLKYVTNFTGSNGTAVFDTKEEKVYFLTDGRYTVQAKLELDKDVTLIEMKLDLETELLKLLDTLINKNSVLCFNGDEVSIILGEKILHKYLGRTKEIIYDRDIVSKIYNQPNLPNTDVYVLDDFTTGESVSSKIQKIRLELQKQSCDSTFISSLTDIAYITNMRANDVLYNTVFYAYLYIDLDKAILLININTLNNKAKEHLKKNNIEIKDYNSSRGFIPNGKVLLDPYCTTLYFYKKFKNAYLSSNPSSRFKAIKNSVELQNMKYAHLEDAVAMIRFIKWVKTSHELVDEFQVATKLESFRMKNKNYLIPSFTTISGFNENGAIVHYSPSHTNSKKIQGDGLLLVDSGGQYKYGTTDITRTLVINKASEEQKYHFTLVLKSFIQLHQQIFIQGCSGQSLDIIARNPLWQVGLDYKHGTGHGVGFFNSVHEGPNRIFYRFPNNRFDDYTLAENMLTSIEPGLYFENKYGIRHENVVSIIQVNEVNGNTFLGFSPLTLVPIDLQGINESLLTEEEKLFLNNYHIQVRTNPFILKHLEPDEIEYLNEITQPI
jgi:Xaa-Pro aminopeptidase